VQYYPDPSGAPTGTVEDSMIALGYLLRMFADLPQTEFDLACFKTVHQIMIEDDRVRTQVTCKWAIDGLVKEATREGEGDELVSVR
jgi:hypothetical protein